MSQRSPRPVDASSLVLYRGRGTSLEILVGLRGARHVFLPNRLVYPGGRVDTTDARISPGTPLRDDVAARLQRTATASRARALAVAAVRELFEETGLLLAAGDDMPDRWHPRIAPRLDTLDYIFRAVTPPGRTRRFNTRFFLAAADETVRGELGGDGELENLGWIGIEELRALPLMWITRAVLDEAQRLIDAPPPPDPDRQIPVSHPRREPGRLRLE